MLLGVILGDAIFRSSPGAVRQEKACLQTLGVVVIQQKWLDTLPQEGLAPLRVLGSYTSCHKGTDCCLLWFKLLSLIEEFGDQPPQLWVYARTLLDVSYNLWPYLQCRCW